MANRRHKRVPTQRPIRQELSTPAGGSAKAVSSLPSSGRVARVVAGAEVAVVVGGTARDQAAVHDEREAEEPDRCLPHRLGACEGVGLRIF